MAGTESTRFDMQNRPILKAFYDKHPDGVFIIDAEGRYLDANPAFETLSGYSRDEIIRLAIENFMVLKDANLTKAHIREVLQGRPQDFFEIRLIRKNGSPIDVQITLIPIVMDERMPGLFCIAKDITRQRQEEQKLRESEQRFRSAFEYAPIGMSLVSMDGRWMRVNQVLCEILGYSERELWKLTFQELTHEADYEQERKYLQQLFDRKIKLYSMDKRYYRKDGSLVWTNITVSLIRSDEGDPLYYIVKIRDITERVQLEEMKRQQDELLRRADKLSTVGQMVSSIAHEIRNPLTSIRGFLQLLQSRTNGKEASYFEIMLGELDRANGILTDFLTLSKTRSLQLEVHSLNDILESLHPLLSADFNMGGHQLNLKLDRAVGTLLMDEREIKQLVLNLVRNALDAMRGSGRVKLVTKKTDEGVRFQVIDNGCGIPQEKLSSIFEPFVTTKDAGTGLGLPVCLSIVEKHGGKMTIESQANVGTTVTVDFPDPLQLLVESSSR